MLCRSATTFWWPSWTYAAPESQAGALGSADTAIQAIGLECALAQACRKLLTTLPQLRRIDESKLLGWHSAPRGRAAAIATLTLPIAVRKGRYSPVPTAGRRTTITQPLARRPGKPAATPFADDEDDREGRAPLSRVASPAPVGSSQALANQDSVADDDENPFRDITWNVSDPGAMEQRLLSEVSGLDAVRSTHSSGGSVRRLRLSKIWKRPHLPQADITGQHLRPNSVRPRLGGRPDAGAPSTTVLAEP